MNAIECDYEEFFDILHKAVQNKVNIQRSDEHRSLKCGFKIGENRYLMKVKGLKYAKDNGLDVSAYNNLK